MTALEELEKVIEEFYRARGYEVKVTLKKKDKDGTKQ